MRKTVHIQNLRNQAIIADQCIVAESYFSRLKGLMGTRELRFGQGLLLRPCNDIHMWFMKISIDALFIVKISGDRYKVVSLYECLRPWKLLPVGSRKATATLEVPAGTVQLHEIRVGDELCIN